VPALLLVLLEGPEEGPLALPGEVLRELWAATALGLATSHDGSRHATFPRVWAAHRQHLVVAALVARRQPAPHSEDPNPAAPWAWPSPPRPCELVVVGPSRLGSARPEAGVLGSLTTVRVPLGASDERGDGPGGLDLPPSLAPLALLTARATRASAVFRRREGPRVVWRDAFPRSFQGLAEVSEAVRARAVAALHDLVDVWWEFGRALPSTAPRGPRPRWAAPHDPLRQAALVLTWRLWTALELERRGLAPPRTAVHDVRTDSVLPGILEHMATLPDDRPPGAVAAAFADACRALGRPAPPDAPWCGDLDLFRNPPPFTFHPRVDEPEAVAAWLRAWESLSTAGARALRRGGAAAPEALLRRADAALVALGRAVMGQPPPMPGAASEAPDLGAQELAFLGGGPGILDRRWWVAQILDQLRDLDLMAPEDAPPGAGGEGGAEGEGGGERPDAEEGARGLRWVVQGSWPALGARYLPAAVASRVARGALEGPLRHGALLGEDPAATLALTPVLDLAVGSGRLLTAVAWELAAEIAWRRVLLDRRVLAAASWSALGGARRGRGDDGRGDPTLAALPRGSWERFSQALEEALPRAVFLAARGVEPDPMAVLLARVSLGLFAVGRRCGAGGWGGERREVPFLGANILCGDPAFSTQMGDILLLAQKVFERVAMGYDMIGNDGPRNGADEAQLSIIDALRSLRAPENARRSAAWARQVWEESRETAEELRWAFDLVMGLQVQRPPASFYPLDLRPTHAEAAGTPLFAHALRALREGTRAGPVRPMHWPLVAEWARDGRYNDDIFPGLLLVNPLNRRMAPSLWPRFPGHLAEGLGKHWTPELSCRDDRLDDPHDRDGDDRDFAPAGDAPASPRDEEGLDREGACLVALGVRIMGYQARAAVVAPGPLLGTPEGRALLDRVARDANCSGRWARPRRIVPLRPTSKAPPARPPAARQPTLPGEDLSTFLLVEP